MYKNDVSVYLRLIKNNIYVKTINQTTSEIGETLRNYQKLTNKSIKSL